MDIEKTLAERGNRYGDFAEHAMIAQLLKEVMWGNDGWNRLTPAMRQALEVIQDKVARILSGDPTYADNWHDIIGYARLVEKTLGEPKSESELVRDVLHNRAYNIVWGVWESPDRKYSSAMRRIIAVEAAAKISEKLAGYVADNFVKLENSISQLAQHRDEHTQD